MKTTTGSRREWGAELLFGARLERGRTINQILVNTDESFVLISSSESDSDWSILDKKRSAALTGCKRIAWKWFNRPSTPPQLFLFEDKVLKLSTGRVSHKSVFPRTRYRRYKLKDGSRIGSVDLDAISISSEGSNLVLMQKL